MKIGIVTFHRAINYGAVLQAYALQESIRNLGHEAQIVDYRSAHIEAPYSVVARLKNAKSLKYLVYLMLHEIKPMILKKKAIQCFVKQYLKLSDEFTTENISDASNIFDKFFTGSDQVWNYRLTQNDDVYFLGFVKDNQKKYSYSASIGLNSIPQELKPRYHELLTSFEAISVREPSAKSLIQEIVPDKEIVVSADPTILLTAQEWKNRLQIQSQPGKKYVLIYELISSDTLVDAAIKDAELNDYVVLRMCSTKMPKKCNVRNVYGATPKEFISLIANAQCVYTNSFHGTVFALNFDKNLKVELLKEPYEKLNMRILDVLETCHANACIIGNDCALPVDKKLIQGSLAKMRQSGLNYIKKVLDNEN